MRCIFDVDAHRQLCYLKLHQRAVQMKSLHLAIKVCCLSIKQADAQPQYFQQACSQQMLHVSCQHVVEVQPPRSCRFVHGQLFWYRAHIRVVCLSALVDFVDAGPIACTVKGKALMRFAVELAQHCLPAM